MQLGCHCCPLQLGYAGTKGRNLGFVQKQPVTSLLVDKKHLKYSYPILEAYGYIYNYKTHIP